MYVKLKDRLTLKGPFFESRLARLRRLKALRQMNVGHRRVQDKLVCDECATNLDTAYRAFVRVARRKHLSSETSELFWAASELADALGGLALRGIEHREQERVRG